MILVRQRFPPRGGHCVLLLLCGVSSIRLGHLILFEDADKVALEFFKVSLLSFSKRLYVLHHLRFDHIVGVLVQCIQRHLVYGNNVSILEYVTVVISVIAPQILVS